MPRAAKPPHRRSSATPPPRRRRVISPRPRVVEDEPELIEQAPPIETHQPAFHHEEKRRLILAHAQARRERPRGLGFFHYVAIVASCFVIMIGWWMTMERNFALPSSGQSFAGVFQNSLENAARQQQQFFPSADSETNLDRRLNQADQEVRGRNAAEAQVMDQTARRLLQPLSSSTASTTQ